MPLIQSGAAPRQDLAACVNDYDAEAARAMFIGRTVLPLFSAATKTGEYAVFSRDNFTKVVDSRRAPDGGYNDVDAELSYKTFACEEHGLKANLDDSQAAQYGRYLDYEASMSRVLWHKLLLNHEIRVEALLAGNVSMTAASTAWATIATADILGDVQTAANAISDEIGVPKERLTLIVNRTDFQHAKNNAAILDRIKYVNTAVSSDERTAQMLAEVMGIGGVLVGAGGRDSAGKGVTASFSGIWRAGYAYLAYLVPSENEPLETPGLGRTILWTADSPVMPVVETYRDEDRRSDVIRERFCADEVLQGSDVDLFAYGITTTG